MSVLFNRSLKSEYSWLPKGNKSSIINNFAGEGAQWYQLFLQMENSFALLLTKLEILKIFEILCKF